MSILTEEIKKDITISEDGKVSCSRRGLAYLCGADKTQIRRDIIKKLAGDISPSESLKPYTGQDFQGGDKLPDYLCAAIVQHYAIKGKPEAIQSLCLFSAIGFRQWGREIKGWKQPDQYEGNAYTRRLAITTEKINLPSDYWSIFHECSLLMGKLEKHFNIEKLDLVDGSVGKRWSNYRKTQEEKGVKWLRTIIKYQHPFPDHRHTPMVNAYHIDELKHFRFWFDHEYQSKWLWVYLQNKYPKPLVESGKPKMRKGQLNYNKFYYFGG